MDLGMFLVVVVIFAFYMLPTFISNIRKTEHQDAIGIINLIFGWTVLGWIAALLWAVTARERTAIR